MLFLWPMRARVDMALGGCSRAAIGKDSRRTECTLRHDAASRGSDPNLIAVSGPKRNATIFG